MDPSEKIAFGLNQEKRTRLRRQATMAAVREMRAHLPVYSIEQIREHKLPLYEARLVNLRSKGFGRSASMLEELVSAQTRAREQAGPGSNVWMRPQLRYSNSEFDRVSRVLHESERARQRGDHAHECKTLLALAIEFCFENPDWFWLGERLIGSLINVAVETEALDRRYEAIGRFVYAKFLIENNKEYNAAMEQLRVSRQLAIHRGWTLKEFLPDVKENLFSAVSYHTYLCYIREAQLAMSSDAHKAVELADLARKRAAEICYREGETEGLMIKGECLLKLKNPQRAIVCFEKALKLQEGMTNDQGICRALIALSKAYTMSGDALKALKTLGEIDTRAASDTLNYYRALAYKNMGEFYLDRGMPAKGNPLLHLSLDLFQQVAQTPPENLQAELASEIEQVQLLEALSTGLELYPYYIDLIINYDQTDEATGTLKLSKLVAWKDLRTSFWDEETVRKDLSVRVLEMKEFEMKQSVASMKKARISPSIVQSQKNNKVTLLKDILEEASIILNSEDVIAI